MAVIVANANPGGAGTAASNHFRATVTFTGAAGAGAVGTVTVATITGRVLVKYFTAYCTTLLGGATATLSAGTAGDVGAFVAITTATDVDASEWWTAATPAVGAKSPLEVLTGGLVTSQGAKLLDENIILTVGTAGITSGVIVFDVFYDAITDGAGLA